MERSVEGFLAWDGIGNRVVRPKNGRGFDSLSEGQKVVVTTEALISSHVAEQTKELREALRWYEEIAASSARYGKAKNDKALEALFVELANDAGKRARAALSQASKEEEEGKE